LNIAVYKYDFAQWPFTERDNDVDLILIALGIAGSVAIMIAAYVFVMTPQNYGSQYKKRTVATPTKPNLNLVPRSPKDRRQGKSVTFPLAINGILVANDRRTQPDRRALA